MHVIWSMNVVEEEAKPLKSRLGPRPDVNLQARKKIYRSPYRATNPRKRQAVSHDESPKKRLNDNAPKRAHGALPPPPMMGPVIGKNKEGIERLVVDEIPPANLE